MVEYHQKGVFMDKDLQLLRVAEVARITGLKEKTIRVYCARRTIPYVKLNGAVLFDLAEIIKWINKSKIKPLRYNSRKEQGVQDAE
jgi:predicted DNA-binding transcriptional regulator AlpA